MALRSRRQWLSGMGVAGLGLLGAGLLDGTLAEGEKESQRASRSSQSKEQGLL